MSETTNIAFSEDEVRRILAEVVADSGFEKAVAIAAGCSQAFLNDVLHGRRRVSGPLMRALGFGRVWFYLSRAAESTEDRASLARGEIPAHIADPTTRPCPPHFFARRKDGRGAECVQCGIRADWLRGKVSNIVELPR